MCTALRPMAVPLFSTAGTLPHPWLPVDLHSDAACAVIQTLGRFMASYFTNQPLYIRPPHHVASLPPLHLPRCMPPYFICLFKKKKYIHYIYSVACFLSPECRTFGAALSRGGFQSGATTAAVRGVDCGLCPGHALAGGASPGDRVVGLPSRGLEVGCLSWPGLHELLHGPL